MHFGALTNMLMLFMFEGCLDRRSIRPLGSCFKAACAAKTEGLNAETASFFCFALSLISLMTLRGVLLPVCAVGHLSHWQGP